MIGMFGSYVTDNVPVGTDLVDLIYENEKLRCPEKVSTRDKFGLVNFNLVCPSGTSLILNNSEQCRVVITDTKSLVIPVDYFIVRSCILEADCASVNCRYLY